MRTWIASALVVAAAWAVPARAQEYMSSPDAAGPAAESVAPPPQRTVDALRSDPDAVRAGIESYKRRQFAEAARVLETAVVETPSLTRAWYALGLAYWADGKLDLAADAWRRYRTLDPENPHVHEWLGDVLSLRGDLAGALEAYEAASRLQPANVDLRARRIRIARWMGYVESSVDDLRTLCGENPARTDFKRDLAAALFTNRQYAEAAPLWLEICRQRPTDQDARIREIACRAYAFGDPVALREAEAFLLQHPSHPDALRLLADLSESGGNPIGALAFLRRLAPLIQDPRKRSRVVFRMTNIIETQNEIDPQRFPVTDGIAMLEEHLKEFPEDADVSLLLGELFLQAGEADRAAGVFRSVLQRFNPQNLRAERGLFEIAVLRQDYREGLNEANRIASFNPDDPYLHYLRARLEAIRRNFVGALDEIAQLERKGASGAVAVLLYHGLTETEWIDIPSTALMREQLTALREAGFRFIAAHEISSCLAAHPAPAGDLATVAPERVACVTFDDARRDAMRLGTPLSRELDIPFYMHVPVGYVERNHPFIAGWDDLRRDAQAGRWHYGSHALDAHDPKPENPEGVPVHPLANRLWLTDANRAETEQEYLARLDVEYRTSHERMAKELASPEEQNAIAYPFGDIGQLSHCNVTNAPQLNLKLAAQYYRQAFIQSHFGYAVRSDNPLLYQRTEPYRTESGAALRDRLLAMHPVFVARALRAEIAAQAGKPYLARETLALLERDGYPAGRLARLRARIDSLLGKSIFGIRFGRPPPPARPVADLHAAPVETGAVATVTASTNGPPEATAPATTNAPAARRAPGRVSPREDQLRLDRELRSQQMLDGLRDLR